MPVAIVDAALQSAIEAFAHGFAFTRSFKHPFLADQIDGVWALRDGLRRGKQPYRSEEWVAIDQPPEHVDAVARAGTRGRFKLCVVARPGDEPATRDAYKAIGYRLQATEPLMVHPLSRVPACQCPADIARVLDAPTADRAAKFYGSRQLLPEHLKADAPVRLYVATIGEQVVGQVRSVRTPSGAAWCTNVFVAPKFRRRGIAKSLLAQMLRDDRRGGATQSVLLASHAGAQLYPHVGYRQIGTLLMLTPKKR
jgi:GNAT superfamily N-acetyltransferase